MSAMAMECPQLGDQYELVTWPTIGMGLGWFGFKTACAPSSKTTLGIQGFQANQLFAILSDAILTLHTRLPMNGKGFFMPTAQPMFKS